MKLWRRFGVLVSLFCIVNASASELLASGENALRKKIRGREVEVRVFVDSYSGCLTAQSGGRGARSLQLSVDGKIVEGPFGSTIDFPDVSRVQLDSGTVGSEFVLTIFGGDASQGYFAKIHFTADRVTRADFFVAASPANPIESRIYRRIIVP